jgi:hypothetical protein
MMLRNAILGLVLLGLAACLVGALRVPDLWPSAIMLGLLAAALLFERNRYQERLSVPPGERLKQTAERFIDPESGRPVRVWLDPAGKRHYVEEPPAADRA